MRGVPVTTRIQQITQPTGGYLPPNQFKKQGLVPDSEGLGFLYSKESVPGNIVGLAVDYLTRLALGDSVSEAFKISIMGAKLMDQFNPEGDHLAIAQSLFEGLKSPNPEEVITNACQLVSYDVVIRAGPQLFKPAVSNYPDQHTIYNILTMVNRMIYFNKTVGPITHDGFTFQGGYTAVVSKGDGDFLTKDTLWDMKVLRSGITSDHTLQVYMYYLMGKASVHSFFDAVEKVGIVNPRLNTYYTLEVSSIAEATKKEVQSVVIGY